MKLFLFAFVIFVVAAATGDGALAQNYPWCADYSSGGTNCGFVTFEQCLATVSGIGGFCDPNTQYVPGAPGDFNPWSGKRRREGSLRLRPSNAR